MRDIVIFGAQGMALGVYKAISVMLPEVNVITFLVTEMGTNPITLAGISVREVYEFVSNLSNKDKDKITVLIATPEDVMKSIELSLDETGMRNHVRIDSARWAHMMELSFVKMGEYLPLSQYLIGNRRPNISVYKMIHHKDRKLEFNYGDPSYSEKLQVGAANGKERIASLADDIDDNISNRNGTYSELTGLYWMWKNRIKCDSNYLDNYYGLSHYRRRLMLLEDDLLRLVDNEIDVVLPYPMPYEPNIGVHSKRYLSSRECEAMEVSLKEVYPEYADDYDKIMNQGYLYNYNIILAKGKALDEYCSWLFPLLFKIEKMNDSEGIKKTNRYIGYVGETLETLYFMHNRNKYRMAHVGCEFLL